jgi:hypothetical protein
MILKEEVIDDGRGQCFHNRLLKFTPGCVQRHFSSSKPPPPPPLSICTLYSVWQKGGGGRVSGCVGDLYCRIFTLYKSLHVTRFGTYKISCHTKTKTWEGQRMGPQTYKQLRTVLFQVTFMTKRF